MDSNLALAMDGLRAFSLQHALPLKGIGESRETVQYKAKALLILDTLKTGKTSITSGYFEVPSTQMHLKGKLVMK